VLCETINGACKRKFRVEPLSLPAFIGVGIAAIALWEGVLYYYDAIAKHKDLDDALALLGLGGSGILLTFFICIRLTNAFYGIAATLILIAFGVIVAPVMILGILSGAFASEQHVAVRKRFWE